MLSFVRRWAVPAVSLLFWVGLQVSGYENPALALLLFVVAAGWGIVALVTWEPIRRHVPGLCRPGPMAPQPTGSEIAQRLVALPDKGQGAETPKLDLVFGDQYKSCFHRYQRMGHWARLFRVGIINSGARSAQGVAVYLVGFEPQGADFLPVRLRFMHERTEMERSQEYTLSVDPGDEPTKFVDVVRKFETGPNSDHIVIEYATPGIPNEIVPGRYKFNLQVQGKDVQEPPKSFVVDVDPDGYLIFQAEEPAPQS